MIKLKSFEWFEKENKKGLIKLIDIINNDPIFLKLYVHKKIPNEIIIIESIDTKKISVFTINKNYLY